MTTMEIIAEARAAERKKNLVREIELTNSTGRDSCAVLVKKIESGFFCVMDPEGVANIGHTTQTFPTENQAIEDAREYIEKQTVTGRCGM